MKKIVLNLFHPSVENSKINNDIYNFLDSISNIQKRDLYKTSINGVNVQKEREVLLENDIFIFQGPIYWYSLPSLFKEWLDIVLSEDFIFSGEYTKLAKKKVLFLLTAGSDKRSYSYLGSQTFEVDQFLLPLKYTFSNFLQMEWIKPIICYKDSDLDEFKNNIISVINSSINNQDTQINHNIPYGKQNITDTDISAVITTMQSDFLTQGPKVTEFEDNYKQTVHSKYAISCNSATSALHVACLALGLTERDIAWTVPNSFVASANCILYCRASVDFVDIDPDTFNISISALEEKLQWANNNNCLPKILIVVHFAGEPCDMEAIYKICKSYNVKIIEDASHAVGARYKNTIIGDCTFSDITVFSFHPVKIITTGEGGMITTNSNELYQEMKQSITHGINKNISQDIGDWYYEQQVLGYNYRMTDMQASLGISQLNRINDFLQKRHEIADYYDEKLKNFPIKTQLRNSQSYSSLHLYPIVLPKDINRKTAFDYMRTNNIGVQVHYIPIHTQPFYKNLGFQQGDFPNSEQYYNSCFSLPMYYDLSRKEQEKILQVLYNILV